MKTPTVTYTGPEVALLAGCIARTLPLVGTQDYDVLDLMLERALAALPQPLAPDIALLIKRLRERTHTNMEDTDRA